MDREIVVGETKYVAQTVNGKDCYAPEGEDPPPPSLCFVPKVDPKTNWTYFTNMATKIKVAKLPDVKQLPPLPDLEESVRIGETIYNLTKVGDDQEVAYVAAGDSSRVHTWFPVADRINGCYLFVNAESKQKVNQLPCRVDTQRQLQEYFRRFPVDEYNSLEEALKHRSEYDLLALLKGIYGADPAQIAREILQSAIEANEPAKLNTIEATLKEWEGNERQLVDAIKEGYPKIPPTVRQRVAAIYKNHNPEKLLTVDETLKAVPGREVQLIAALVKKYNVDAETASTRSSSSSVEEYRARALAMYRKYNPAKVDTVDQGLKRFAGQEELLIEALVKKYGPEPSPDEAGEESKPNANESSNGGSQPTDTPTQPPAGDANLEQYRQRVRRFYQFYCPEKVGNVDRAMEMYKDQEDLLIESLVKKYGPEPEPGAEPPRERGFSVIAQDYRARVEAMYDKYAPEKKNTIDRAMGMYAGREDQLIAALVRKYGPEPGREDEAQPADVQSLPSLTSEESSEDDYKLRIERFYTYYKPEKMNTIPTVMKAYKGKEARMMSDLVRKYGPEPTDEDLERVKRDRPTADSSSEQPQIEAAAQEDHAAATRAADGTTNDTPSSQTTPVAEHTVDQTKAEAEADTQGDNVARSSQDSEPREQQQASEEPVEAKDAVVAEDVSGSAKIEKEHTVSDSDVAQHSAAVETTVEASDKGSSNAVEQHVSQSEGGVVVKETMETSAVNDSHPIPASSSDGRVEASEENTGKEPSADEPAGEEPEPPQPVAVLPDGFSRIQRFYDFHAANRFPTLQHKTDDEIAQELTECGDKDALLERLTEQYGPDESKFEALMDRLRSFYTFHACHRFPALSEKTDEDIQRLIAHYYPDETRDLINSLEEKYGVATEAAEDALAAPKETELGAANQGEPVSSEAPAKAVVDAPVATSTDASNPATTSEGSKAATEDAAISEDTSEARNEPDTTNAESSNEVPSQQAVADSPPAQLPTPTVETSADTAPRATAGTEPKEEASPTAAATLTGPGNEDSVEREEVGADERATEQPRSVQPEEKVAAEPVPTEVAASDPISQASTQPGSQHPVTEPEQPVVVAAASQSSAVLPTSTEPAPKRSVSPAAEQSQEASAVEEVSAVKSAEEPLAEKPTSRAASESNEPTVQAPVEVAAGARTDRTTERTTTPPNITQSDGRPTNEDNIVKHVATENEGVSRKEDPKDVQSERPVESEEPTSAEEAAHADSTHAEDSTPVQVIPAAIPRDGPSSLVSMLARAEQKLQDADDTIEAITKRCDEYRDKNDKLNEAIDELQKQCEMELRGMRVYVDQVEAESQKISDACELERRKLRSEEDLAVTTLLREVEEQKLLAQKQRLKHLEATAVLQEAIAELKAKLHRKEAEMNSIQELLCRRDTEIGDLQDVVAEQKARLQKPKVRTISQQTEEEEAKSPLLRSASQIVLPSLKSAESSIVLSPGKETSDAEKRAILECQQWELRVAQLEQEVEQLQQALESERSKECQECDTATRVIYALRARNTKLTQRIEELELEQLCIPDIPVVLGTPQAAIYRLQTEAEDLKRQLADCHVQSKAYKSEIADLRGLLSMHMASPRRR